MPIFIWHCVLDSNPTWMEPSSAEGTHCFSCLEIRIRVSYVALFRQSYTRIIWGGGRRKEGEGWDPFLAPYSMGEPFSVCNWAGEWFAWLAVSALFPASPCSHPSPRQLIWPWFSAEASLAPFVCCCLVSMWSWKPGIQVLVLSFILPCCVTFLLLSTWAFPVQESNSSSGCSIWAARNTDEFVCERVPPGKCQHSLFQKGNWVAEGG